ncbi:MAG: hypothetical protein HOM58_22960 [Rhodospirillaceae bacterium]|jgi:hypothetical protein|nr:hypothetical protein [Rhodospirillaceae bacterium]MBT5459407.1 hypothetical protein [Rhodospirillaceae bacterium]
MMNDPVGHAKAYPFPAPDHCFLYEGGGWKRLHDGVETTGRSPVLAAGSNQSPEQLARKYGGMTDIGAIPAQRGRLHDFDVVYAAHLARYGSVPATFQRSPGTAVTVFVLWLTDEQLQRMHETEGNYTYDHLNDILIELDAGEALTEAFAYSSKIGCLAHEGDCIGLAEIAARNRRFRALRQAEVLALIRDRLDPGTDLDLFISQHAGEYDVLRERSKRLGDDAISTSYRRRTILAL